MIDIDKCHCVSDYYFFRPIVGLYYIIHLKVKLVMLV